jgi:alkylation response protein AidB-like acyl-CoA dehydrogenase
MPTELLSPELADLRALAHDFGVNEIRPRIHALEQAGEFPRELYRRMGDLGFFGCLFSEEFGGTDMGYQALVVIAEQIAWAYPPLSACFNLQGCTVPLTIANWGPPEMAQHYVPGLVAGTLLGYNAMTEPDGGSDFLGAMKTRITRDGDAYVINGAKMFITNANVADVGIVYGKTNPEAGHKGVSAFIVESSSPGFSYQRVPCRVLGALMPTTSLSLQDCRVPAENMLGEEGGGFKVAMNAMDYGRLCVAARQLGLAQACLDASLGYAAERQAFGQAIGHFQMIKQQIADMVAEIGAARLLVYQAASLYDAGRNASRESAIAKYFVGEVCNRAAQATAEIFGGYAFTDEYPIGIYLNYAKLWQTGEGSANIQRVLIADDALGFRSMDRHQSIRRPKAGAPRV